MEHLINEIHAAWRNRHDYGRLSLFQILAYVNMKFSLIFNDVAVSIIVPVYIEVMQVPIGALSVARLIAKSFDFAWAFVVGFMSDSLDTPCGQRMPFLLIGSLLAPLWLWCLASPPSMSSPDLEQSLSATDGLIRGCNVLSLNNCTKCFADCETLESCVHGAIAGSRLPTPSSFAAPVQERFGNNGKDESEQQAALMSLCWWFFVFFTLRHSAGHTLLQVPYDALGQELTTLDSQRRRLFAWKSSFTFAGLISGYAILMVLSIVLASDLFRQARTMVAMASAMQIISGLWLVCFLRESYLSRRKRREKRERQRTLFLATAYSLARNAPYRNYLYMRLSLTLAFHLPAMLRLQYLKYVLHFENAALAQSSCAFAVQLFSLSTLPYAARIMARVGKARSVLYISLLSCLCAVGFAVFHPDKLRSSNLWLAQPVVEGLTQACAAQIEAASSPSPLSHACSRLAAHAECTLWRRALLGSLARRQVALYLIPDTLLATVIDYDQLVSGSRREGIYVAADVNILQVMDILAGVAPGLVRLPLATAIRPRQHRSRALLVAPAWAAHRRC